MRALIALWIGIAPFVLGCEGVPDLHFGSAVDAGSATEDDATVTAVDSSSGQTIPDATTVTDAEKADAHTPIVPQDSASPPPQTDGAPPSVGCPGNPPVGVTCCGSVECKGSATQCNCNQCAFCASEGFCCVSMYPPCATKLSDCP